MGAGLGEQDELKRWFCREVLPLEPALTRFLRRNWRSEGDIAEFRQDVYARVLAAAAQRRPTQAKAFLFAAARNHLINAARRAAIVSFELVADLESAAAVVDEVTPERQATARETLRRVQQGLERLPPRCREVVVLKKIEGLSQQEIAVRLDITVHTVEQQLMYGMRALADFMLGGSGRIQRPAAAKRPHEADAHE